jgi:hypothetical protein
MRSSKDLLAMPTYADVFVSKELLEKLVREKQLAPKEQKYGRYKNWLHYANLKSWQEQGWHFNFLNYMGREHHCTCGLIVPVDHTPELPELAHVKVDEVQRSFGHRALPALKGAVTAFIYDYKWMEDLGVYHYQALCQICLKATEILPARLADEFIELHNRSCLSAKTDTVRG